MFCPPAYPFPPRNEREKDHPKDAELLSPICANSTCDIAAAIAVVAVVILPYGYCVIY